MCDDFIAPSFQLLQVHLFRVNCCNTTFKSASAYRKHIQRHHRASITPATTSSTTDLSLICSTDEDDDSNLAGTQVVAKDKLDTAKWILKLKETKKLTQSSVDSILEDATELCATTVSELGFRVESLLNTAGIRFNDIPGLREIFAPTSPYCNPFDGLDTYHRQLSFYRKHFNFVVSACSYCTSDEMLVFVEPFACYSRHTASLASEGNR